MGEHAYFRLDIMMKPELQIEVVDEGRWGDFERLFEGKGGPSYCWCMAWRQLPAGVDRNDRSAKKAAMRQRVGAGEPVGLLAYRDGEPVGWCSVAPRTSFRPLGGVAYDGVDDDEVWSIVCFFVHRSARGSGAARLLLDAAVAHAERSGAKVVEGYPVDPESPSYRFMGYVSMFAQAGFEEVGCAGARRHVMARRLA